METESKKLCRGAAVHLHRRTRSAPDSCFILGEPSPPTNRFFRQDTVWMFQACPCSSETTSKPETQLDPTSVSWSLSCGGHHPSLVLTWPRLVFGARLHARWTAASPLYRCTALLLSCGRPTNVGTHGFWVARIGFGTVSRAMLIAMAM